MLNKNYKRQKRLGVVVDDLGLITNDNKEAGAELIHATKIIGDELKERGNINRISERFGK